MSKTQKRGDAKASRTAQRAAEELDFRQVLSYEDVERFPYLYGFDVESSEVNVFTLTPALEAFAKALSEASRTLHPEAPAIVVRVRPFKKGSLLADLVLTAPAWGPLMVAYGHSSYTYIQKILEVVGFIRTAHQTVLKVIDRLKKPPSKIEETRDGFRYYSPDVKNPITVSAPVHQIIQNNYFMGYLHDAVVAPLDKEKSIKAVVLRGKRRRELPVKVQRKQIAAIKEFKNKPLPKPKGNVENTTVEFLQPKRGSFDGDGKQWSFHRGKEIIHANIKDTAFLERYRRGQVRMHHTDVLKAKMKQQQKLRNGKVFTAYDILEVLEYTPGYREERLREGS